MNSVEEKRGGWNKGMKMKYKERPSMKGRTAWNKGIKKQTNTGRTHFKKGHVSVNKNKQLLNRRGEKHHNWKGGKEYIDRHTEMGRIEYKLWVNVCLARDGYTCRKTGAIGGKLRVHHLDSYADFPEKRLSIDNGVTLSEEAHVEFHKIYGNKHNTKEQFYEFINLN